MSSQEIRRIIQLMESFVKEMDTVVPVEQAFVVGGDGYWTKESKPVMIDKMSIEYIAEDDQFGELRLYFDTDEWDVQDDNVIYTDNQFINEFKDWLTTIGFTAAALDQLDYSERGMQGDDFVSFDIGGLFITEYLDYMAKPHSHW